MKQLCQEYTWQQIHNGFHFIIINHLPLLARDAGISPEQCSISKTDFSAVVNTFVPCYYQSCGEALLYQLALLLLVSEAEPHTKIMMTVIIPYQGNQHGLSQLLVSLQPQLHPDDDIYIIDMTKDLSGVKIAGLYGSTRCYIFVETAPNIDSGEAIKRGIESMKENKQDCALIITEQCVITNTFIANMKKALKVCNHCTLIPHHSDVLPGDDRMDANFTWYGSSQTKIMDVDSEDWARELTTQCKLIRNLPEDEGEHSLGLVANETIVVLPGR